MKLSEKPQLSWGSRQQKIAPAILSAPALIVGGGLAPARRSCEAAHDPRLFGHEKRKPLIGCEASDLGCSVFRESCGSMTKLIGWARLRDRAFSAADKVGGRAPQGAQTGAEFVADVALATR